MVLLIDGVTGVPADAGVEDHAILEVQTTLAKPQERLAQGLRITTRVGHLHHEQDRVDDEDAAPPTLD